MLDYKRYDNDENLLVYRHVTNIICNADLLIVSNVISVCSLSHIINTEYIALYGQMTTPIWIVMKISSIE